MKIEFDKSRNPKPFTIILAKRDGSKLGALPHYHLKFSGEFNSYHSMEFCVYKNGNKYWNDIQDFKLVWLKELDLWYEIHVQIGDGNVCLKTVTAKSLGEAELSQTNLYNVEVNTEADIERKDYSPTVFYNQTDKSCSLLDRLLSKTPHYRIVSVPVSLQNIQRTFSFDGGSIYDAFQEVSKEINCYFDFAVHSDENGKPYRSIRVYDLQSYCNSCGERGEFRDACDKCNSVDVTNGYGEDMGIFVSTKNLTDEISFETNEDSVKNCFKLEAGDDLMTATVINCNPNGSAYLWNIPEFTKKDMPAELVEKLDSYNELELYYQNTNVVKLTSTLIESYNLLVEKYLKYKVELTEIPDSIIGFPALMTEYYNTIDFALLLQSSLMPSVETIETTAAEQASRLTVARLSPVAVYSLSSASSSTVDSYVLAMARAQVDYRYQVKILSSSYSGTTWTGSFTVTNYYKEEDTATSVILSITITDNYENYVSQMLDKSLSNTSEYATDIVSLFSLPNSEFEQELKKYSLARLNAFNGCVDACLNILIEHGAGNSETWSDAEDDLYKDLYVPYLNKQELVKAEIQIRESEISTIENIQKEIIENRNAIQNALNFENYIGTDLWNVFISYRREDTYSNNNYVSDGLNNAELFSNAKRFIDVAREELYKSANLQHSLSSTLKNFLVMKEFANLTDKFELGNFIHIQCDDNVYKIRLLSYEFSFDDLSTIPVTFSDVREIKDDISDIQDVIGNSKAMATSYDNVATQAEKGKSSRADLDNWAANGLSLTAMRIINSADNQDYVFDEHGMLFRKYQEIQGTYHPEQLKIINSTIAITNDNWQTVKTAIGSHYYTDPETKEIKYAYGINGEVLIGKIILGEELGIYNSGSTLKFNKDGLYITNGMHSFSLNPNNATNLLNIKKHYNNGTTTDVLRVSEDGLYMSGEIVATSGYIGGTNGWTIKSTYIYNGKTSLNDTTPGVYIGTDGISIGSGDSIFKVVVSGVLTSTSIASWQNDTDSAIASIEQDVSDNSASISSLVTWKNSTNTTIANIKSDVADNSASIESIASWQNDTDSAIASIEQDVSDNSASISAKVSQTYGTSTSSFGWKLLSSGFEIYSSAMTVLKVTSEGLEVAGKIDAYEGTIAGWHITFDETLFSSVLYNPVATYGRLSWTTTGTDYRYVDGYMFNVLFPQGFAYVIKETSEWTSATKFVGSPLDSQKYSFSTSTLGGGGIFEI